jgi:exosortase
MTAESTLETRSRLQGDALPLIAIALGILCAYRALIGFDPYAPVPTDARGLEGALFDPVPSSPGFVFIVFLWKLAEQHQAIRSALRGPGAARAAIPVLGLSFAAFCWATYTGADELLLPSLSAFLVGGGLALGGLRGADELAVPALILLFAFPIPPDLLNGWMFDLQLVTAALATGIANLWGDAFRSGDLIYHDRQIFQVIESCAGLATISTLTLTSFIIPTRVRRKRLHAILLVLTAPFVAFAFNAARVLTIMENPLSHIGTVHTTQGIAMLVAGILVLVAIDRGLGRIFGRARKPAGAAREVPVRSLGALAGMAFALAAVAFALPRWEGDKIRHQSFRQLRTIDAPTGRSLEVDDDFLGTVAFTQAANTRYPLGDSHVDLFVGVNNRTIRHNSATSPKTELPGAGWLVSERRVAMQAGRSVTELVVEPPPHLPDEERRRTLVHHFELGGESVASATGRALLGLDRSPFRRTDRQVVVRLATPVGETQESRNAAAARLAEIAGRLEANLARERRWPEG